MKIEADRFRGKTTLRLIGRLQAEHIAKVKSQLEELQAVRVCLKEVTLVDVDVVRFMAKCQQSGISIVNCPAYIRKWMKRERQLRNS